ncbi:hypothetical protein ACWELQ_14670, partial [Nocardia sp. NPDC004722]
MGRIPTTVGLVPGTGLIARFGNVVLFLPGESGSTERILGAAEAAASAADPGAAIAQRLAATVFSPGSTQPPAFGVVAPTADGILILLRGPVTATIDGPEGTRTLSGERAMTWVDEIVRDPVRRLTVLADGAGNAIAHTDLRAGVVVGGGFVVKAPVSGLAAAQPQSAPPSASSSPSGEPRTADGKAAETGRAQRLSPAADEPGNPRNAATTPAPGSRAAEGGDQRPRVPDQRVRIEVQADGPETRATPAVADVPPAHAHGPRAAGPDLAKKSGAESGSGAGGSGAAGSGAAGSAAGGPVAGGPGTPPRRAGRPDPEDQPPTAAYSPESEVEAEPQ